MTVLDNTVYGSALHAIFRVEMVKLIAMTYYVILAQYIHSGGLCADPEIVGVVFKQYPCRVAGQRGRVVLVMLYMRKLLGSHVSSIQTAPISRQPNATVLSREQL